MSRKGNSGMGRGTFKNAEEFENSLTGLDDPRLKEYSDALSAENEYNRGLKNNLNASIDEDGYDSTTDRIVSAELRDARKILNGMPAEKTPAQLGTIEAVNNRIKILEDIQKRRGARGSGRGNVNIT